MITNRIYYRIKPFVPKSVRMAVRRWHARRERRVCGDRWPIKPGSEAAPAGWPGWPEGKRFAFVLTHDVEGRDGLAKCRQLMELERSLGFRSCFNFIPEGSYSVAKDLREELVGNGFEIGVHDLRHDGRLFSGREEFRRHAARINHYLREWGAVGFRSGFMLRNLDWLHDLNIEYDASTFDTDPFEPQPEGVSTIFPFWVPAPVAQRSEISNQSSEPSPALRPLPSELRTSDFGIRNSNFPPRRAGYVELPYTLPQDSTLFLVLGETTPDLWLRKLDWVTQHGGLALINVHPDYVWFEGETPSAWTYPVAHYRRLLEHVRQRYGDTFWQPLPKELAPFIARQRPVPLQRKSRRVCMVTYSFYESDNRVTRYAEALAARGDSVDVLALRRTPNVPKQETIAGVRVFRIQSRFGKKERRRLAFLLPLVRFLFTASFWITRRQPRTHYELFHIHNVPDFLVFAAWYPRLTGVRIILDIHDIVPEFYASKFGDGTHARTVRLLKGMERVSARFADHVIIANHLWLDRYASRTGVGQRCSVFINNVDSSIFYPRPRSRTDGKPIILFPGGLQWHQGLDIAMRAFAKVREQLPGAEFHIYGDGNMKPSLIALAAELGLDGQVRFFDPLPVRDIAQVMSNADLGVVPKRADSFGNEAYSTKIMEFLALGVPVVVSSTKVDRYYFDDSVVKFFQSGNAEDMACQMIAVMTNPGLRDQLVKHALEYASRNSWDTRKHEYLCLVDRLMDSHASPGQPPLAVPSAAETI